MRRVRFLSMLVLILTIFSTLSVSAQQPIQAQPTVVQQPSVAGDENWDDRFGLQFGTLQSATNATLFSMLEFRGELYVGGKFTFNNPNYHAYNLSTVARWNGRRWASVGVPMWNDGIVTDMTIHNDQLYACGRFSVAGGVTANNIARWDGSQWYALGNGINGDCWSLASYNGSLYVGGRFSQAGSTSVRNLARWDGTAWHDVGSGVLATTNPDNVQVNAFTVGADGLYVGGLFDQAGTLPAHGLARWNGTQWSNVGNFKGDVFALTFHNNQLYAGGLITTTNGYQGVMRWSGMEWQSLTTPFTQTAWSLASIGADLYIGPYYGAYNPSNIPPKLYRWNGTTVSQVGPTFNDGTNWTVPINALTSIVEYQGQLHVAGDIGYFNPPEHAVYSIMRLDDGEWDGLGEGIALISSDIKFLTILNNELFAGGGSTIYGDVAVNASGNIVRFSQGHWYHELSDNGLIYDAATQASIIYVATSAGIKYRQNGTWQLMPNTLGVNKLASNGTELYASGDFTSIGGVPAMHLAKWNGTTWAAISAGSVQPNSVLSLGVHEQNVVIAGNLTNGSTNISGVHYWNGTTWQTLTTDITSVNAITFDGQGTIYIGGRFTTIAGVIVNGIARYSNGQWSALGSGATGGSAEVYDIVIDGATLYIGGSFAQAGGVSASNIAKYENGQWSALGSGTNGVVFALALDDLHRVFMTGWFTKAGDKPSSNFAVWHPNGLFPYRSFIPMIRR